MTEIDREELRRHVEAAHSCVVVPRDTLMLSTRTLLALLDALDEAEGERDKAIAEVARQQALRVENGKRFEQMRSERTAALDRADSAEAAVERVRCFAEGMMSDGAAPGSITGRFILAALAPVTEEGDKE